VLNDPDTARLLDAAGRAYAGGDRAGAASLARQALLRRPGHAQALQLLGVIALDAGEYAAARRHLEAVARPDRVTLNMIGVAAQRLGDGEAARAAFTRAGELGLVDGWRNLAVSESSDTGKRIAAYQRALALAPDDAAAHAGLAQAFEGRHDLVRAREHAGAALRADPANAAARLALARVLMREKDFSGAEAAVAPLVQSPNTPAEQRILAIGLIGDARDRRGDARGAFEAFTAANQLTLQLHGAWLSATERLYHPDNVRRMREAVERIDVASWPADAKERAPAFLIGFPRSGTTLLDQILSSHSGIVCLEESEHFSAALGEVIADMARLWDSHSITEGECARIRQSYWRRVGAPEDAIVVDKFPLNIVVLPLTRRVFPRAKIILALRDPRDVVLSCYQQRFAINAAMAQLLDLRSAGAYYDLVMSLLEACRERLKLNLLQARYEDVVGNLESETHRLCAFLGVPFEPNMLNYRETALGREVATPSARQVIEPLYTRSIGRWRRYEQHLQPVLPILAPWARRYGYST
jgi:tetratricopeptide (TPR) repeat protein